TIAPRLRNPPTGARLDQQVLNISRVTTVIVLLLTMVMAWGLMDTNIALIIWIGTGGLMAAFAGPLVMGALWRGVTRQGAYAGLASGFIVFVVLHSQLLEPGWFGSSGILYDFVSWIHDEGPNPFSCAAMGEAVSISLTFLVSRFTRPLPESHIRDMFGSAGE
ncbi:MAG: sodium:pantothenate symporter, partial [Verrucomicrobiota bacterium]|nr:sodium:pantothenate symporter [Verrucomicrobiota bacterium]